MRLQIIGSSGRLPDLRKASPPTPAITHRGIELVCGLSGLDRVFVRLNVGRFHCPVV